MKQIFALIMAVLFVFCVAGSAMATPPNEGAYYVKIHGEKYLKVQHQVK